MSAIERAARAINLSLHLDRRQIAEAVVASLRADLASGDPERVRKRDTLVPHDHTQRVPGCFRCDLSLLEVFNA